MAYTLKILNWFKTIIKIPKAPAQTVKEDFRVEKFSYTNTAYVKPPFRNILGNGTSWKVVLTSSAAYFDNTNLIRDHEQQKMAWRRLRLWWRQTTIAEHYYGPANVTGTGDPGVRRPDLKNSGTQAFQKLLICRKDSYRIFKENILTKGRLSTSKKKTNPLYWSDNQDFTITCYDVGSTLTTTCYIARELEIQKSLKNW